MTATYNYSTRTGIIVADTADLLADVELEFKNALGQDLNTNSSTPQGTLIGGEVIARGAVMRNNAEQANMINPNFAYGVAIDALMALTGSERGIDKSTIIRQVLISGNNQTNIPALSRISLQNGAVFSLMNPVTIPSTGKVLADFQSEEFGDIDAPVQEATIMDGVIGWGKAEITTGSIVEPGTSALSDPAARNMRVRRLFALGQNSSGSMQAAILAVPNVRSVKVIDQNTGVAGTDQGVTFALASAMWICIDGTPDVNLVAQAIQNNRRPGVPFEYGAAGQGTPVNSPNGVPATDLATGIIYNIKFCKAIELDVYVNVKVKVAGTGSAVNVNEAIPALVIDYANGEIDGENGFVVGASISGFEIAGAISPQMPNVYIKSVTVAVVAKGAAAPLPGAYTTEAVLSPFQVGKTNIGLVKVEQV